MISQEEKSYTGIDGPWLHEKSIKKDFFKRTPVSNKCSPRQTSSPIASHLDFCWEHTHVLLILPGKPGEGRDKYIET